MIPLTMKYINDDSMNIVFVKIAVINILNLSLVNINEVVKLVVGLVSLFIIIFEFFRRRRNEHNQKLKTDAEKHKDIIV